MARRPSDRGRLEPVKVKRLDHDPRGTGYVGHKHDIDCVRAREFSSLCDVHRDFYSIEPKARPDWNEPFSSCGRERDMRTHGKYTPPAREEITVPRTKIVEDYITERRRADHTDEEERG